jgi:Holliday junction DNA helicase RuvA
VIGWLRGDVLGLEANGVVLVDVQGVGYEVVVPSNVLATIQAGSSVELFVHTNVRDDAIVLYGFGSLADRALFRLLVSTPGVGPSTALGALSTLRAEVLASAIVNDDVEVIATIPGIGKKTAARLVLELAGKLPSLGVAAMPDVLPSVASGVDEALRSLGYGVQEIRDALRDVVLPAEESAALRVALQHLGGK